eukprot:1143032-Pelagomonas_calceolata.AAC.4
MLHLRTTCLAPRPQAPGSTHLTTGLDYYYLLLPPGQAYTIASTQTDIRSPRTGLKYECVHKLMALKGFQHGRVTRQYGQKEPSWIQIRQGSGNMKIVPPDEASLGSAEGNVKAKHMPSTCHC